MTYVHIRAWLALAALLGLSSVGPAGAWGQENKEQKKEETQLSAESPNWKVTVLTAEKTHTLDDPRFFPKRGHYYLRLKITFKYLGPSGEIKAPAVHVNDSRGKKHRMLQVQYSPDPHTPRESLEGRVEVALWLAGRSKGFLQIGGELGGRSDKRWLKTGREFRGYSYWFELPEKAADLKLVFVDVPPIRIALQ